MTAWFRPRLAGMLTASGIALALAGCAVDEDGAVVQGSPELCAEIEGRANEAFRRNFLTEYDRAERAWTDILAIYDQRADEVAACEDIPPRSIVLANLGLVYSNQRNFTAALGMLDASAATGGEAVASRTKIYRALHDLNRSAVGAGTLEQAELASVSAGESQGLALLERDLSSSVLQLSREAQRQLIEESVNLAALAFAYMSRGRIDNAMVAVDAALARVAPIDGAASSYVPRFLVTKAEVQLAGGQTDAALSTVREAIRTYGADMRRSALMARAEVVQGRILAAMGREDDALAAFKRGFGILKGVPVRISYDLLWPYVELVQKVIAEKPARREELTGDLFVAAQVVRSQTTASSVSLAAASLAEGTSPLAEAVRELNRASEELALIVAQKLMVEGRGSLSSPGLVAEVTRRFEAANEREQAALERVLSLDPEYLERISGSASIAALQEVLGTDEGYVQIVLGEPESLVFVIRKDAFRMFTVSSLSAAETTAIVAQLRDILRTQFIYTPNESHRIYEAFLAPAEPELAGAGKLVFSLSDALTALPMEILATRRSEIPDLARLEDFTDVAWLGAAYEVSYVPAPRNLIDLRRAAAAREADGRRIVAFGDFQPGADVQEILTQSFLPEECLPIAQAIAQLPPLEGTRTEVATVGQIFGAESSEIIEGQAFNERRIAEASEAGELREYGVLHFATHGILPMGDCIRRPALSVSAAGVEGSDGLLTDVEIRRLSLDADLVVLSACDTAGSAGGDFNAAGGEALSGLARAFFDAGSRAILATHWPVSDATTARIVRDFYTGLRAGKSMTAALREAQEALRRNPATSDPVFWGAFVMIGDAQRDLAIR
ncbi:CHAT domain-containing protein [Limibaculum sp. FT325]|uniref:CHAT domain-containing protein n=1 Tax=Thermohalobaculum sediminis TaxID=2939436 RepID=UPI0020BE5DB4|nr:CHAT domain-containing protein [Limibaculum sediminis]MCL5777321.1 CHAT domain-containing protein [Limibaculum sediminis]